MSKQEKWDEMAATIGAKTDKLGTPIDEGIKEAVIALNLLGFPTRQSCYGHEDSNTTEGPWIDIDSKEAVQLWDRMEALEYPDPEWIRLRDKRKEVLKNIHIQLLDVLKEFYANQPLVYPYVISAEVLAVMIRIAPIATKSLEFLSHKDYQIELKRCQGEFDNFSVFLKAEYFSR